MLLLGQQSLNTKAGGAAQVVGERPDTVVFGQ
jgi:hypothetical protein